MVCICALQTTEPAKPSLRSPWRCTVSIGYLFVENVVGLGTPRDASLSGVTESPFQNNRRRLEYLLLVALITTLTFKKPKIISRKHGRHNVIDIKTGLYAFLEI